MFNRLLGRLSRATPLTDEALKGFEQRHSELSETAEAMLSCHRLAHFDTRGYAYLKAVLTGAPTAADKLEQYARQLAPHNATLVFVAAARSPDMVRERLPIAIRRLLPEAGVLDRRLLQTIQKGLELRPAEIDVPRAAQTVLEIGTRIGPTAAALVAADFFRTAEMYGRLGQAPKP